MQKQPGKDLQTIKELVRSMDFPYGSAASSGTKMAGNLSPMPARSCTKNDGSMSRGADASWSIPLGEAKVKPLYLKFVGERDRGELPKDMTWAKYQEMHK